MVVKEHTSTYSYTYIFYYLFAKFSRKINRNFEITDNNIAMKRNFFKILMLIVCGAALITILSGVIYVGSIKNGDSYVHFDSKKLTKVNSNLTVLDANGDVLQEAMYYKNIKQVPLSALPKHVYMAFVAVEDKRFFEHHGIDVKRVCGAIVHNVKSGTFKEGASTITQQLVKNTHLDNSKTIERKINEMLVARQLERSYTKEQILEIYLNTIYFGRNAYGVENAANVYFGKSASQLSISESATLAGIIKAPNTYAPDKNLAKCKSRRNIVLNLMQEQGIIGDEELTLALEQPIEYVAQNKMMERTYMYFALREACKILNMTECQLLNSAYTIQTFCDAQLQQQVCDVAREDSTLDVQGNLSNLASIVADNCGNVVACYMRGDNADAKGQVGSSFKPIAVYTPALNEKLITQASPVLDEATNFNGYMPKNVGGYVGWTTIKNAVTKSLNVPAVKTLNSLTLSTAERYLAKMGIEGKQNLSLALGNVEGGLTPFELLKCYTALANNGSVSEVKFVDKIYLGKTLVYDSNNACIKVFAPSATFLMTDMLIDVVNNGTAKELRKEYQVAAKTGTVGTKAGNTDALVSGYTTQHTFVVWHRGKFDNTVSGANAPCKLASKLLDYLYKDKAPSNFVPPSGVTRITLDHDELVNNQQLRVSKTGDEFWFDVNNRPTERMRANKLEYAIECKKCHNGVNLILPYVENARWELYKEIEGKTVSVLLHNNMFFCDCKEPATFYAKLYKDGDLLYQTPKVEIVGNVDGKPSQEVKNPLLDFWYWR